MAISAQKKEQIQKRGGDYVDSLSVDVCIQEGNRVRRKSIIYSSGVVFWPSCEASGSSSDLDVLMVTASILIRTL